MAGVRLTGDWNRLENLLDPGTWKEVLDSEVPDCIEEEAAPQIADKMRSVILSGGAGGPGLAASTIARKGSSTKLVESGAMGEAVGVERVDDTTIFVGVLKGKGSHRGIDLADLMAMQEHGTATIPARPALAQAEDGVQDEIMGALEGLFTSGSFWSNF